MRFGSRILGLLALPATALLLLWLAETRPGYFTNLTYLGGLMLLEIVVVAVWHYEKAFFAAMMLAFLWGGSALPLAGAGSMARWVFLIVGATVGVVKWAEQRPRQHLEAIHVIAGLCVLSAAVSAMVSHRSETALLKAASLFLLFLYGSFGARIGVAGREAAFFRGLLTACEITSYVSGLFYVVLHFEVFGNPNSLGAVMGVVVVPVLVWGTLSAEDVRLQYRRTFALCLAAYLLYTSISRAGILACAVAVTIMCVALGRKKLLVKGAFTLIFMAAVIAVVQPTQFDSLVSSITEDVIYKGKPEEGLLGSRMSPWQETVTVIKENPWFGSGFGTALVQDKTVAGTSMFRTMGGSVREHGNSYLALFEYVGILGIVPFALLLFLVLRLIYRACAWMWRCRDPHHYAVPLVLICIAGLVHAFFEDWLFAVGYYLNVFFWTSVFILSDFQLGRSRQPATLRAAWSQVPVNPSRVPLSANQ